MTRRHDDAQTGLDLASLAFPALMSAAVQFRFRITALVVGLLLWLCVTCMLSWNASVGNLIVGRLDALAAQRTVLMAGFDGNIVFAMPALRPASESEWRLAMREQCQPRMVAAGVTAIDVTSAAGPSPAREQLQRCLQLADNAFNDAANRRNLAAWSVPWRAVIDRMPLVKPDISNLPQLTDPRRANDEAVRVLTLVLGGSVLPFFYGVLGAGAAVTRDLWAKMRESLLYPRDSTLAFVQLSLGAIVGACIGLFMPQATLAGREDGMLAVGLLGASALSFIAGFGVHGVFVAMESLLRRVFNLPDPAPKP